MGTKGGEEQTKEGDGDEEESKNETEPAEDEEADEDAEEERKKRKTAAALRLKPKKTAKIVKSKALKKQPIRAASSKLVKAKPKSAAVKKPAKSKAATLKRLINPSNPTKPVTKPTLAKKPASAKLVRKTAPKVAAKKAKTTATAAKAPSRATAKSSKLVKTQKAKPRAKLVSRQASASAPRATYAKPNRAIRASSSAIPLEYRRKLIHVNSGMVQRGRHVRTRRSVVVNEQVLNATFAPMMHSIQIISPIEDFDDKELQAWERLMQLEGSVENEELTDEDRVQRTIATISKIESKNGSLGEQSYCFSKMHLVTATLLLSSMAVIISMTLYMTCSYIYFKHFSNSHMKSCQDKIAYLS